LEYVLVLLHGMGLGIRKFAIVGDEGDAEAPSASLLRSGIF
jgi:hypothetical protein